MPAFRKIINRDFFKKRWHDPFKRVWKMSMPILLAIISVIGIITTFFLTIPWLITEEGEHTMIAIQATLAVVLASLAAVMSYYLSLRQSSKFSPIRIRVRKD